MLEIADVIQEHEIDFIDLVCTVPFLEIEPELFLVLFRPGTMSVWSSLGTFFVPEPEHAKHSLFLVRPLVHPLPSRTYDAEQSTRCPPLDKQCS